MHIWAKLLAALHGNIEESDKKGANKRALLILDQELREVGEELTQAKKNLAEVITHKNAAAAKAQAIYDKIVEYEDYALQALSKDNEELAHEIAIKIAELDSREKEQQEFSQKYEESAEDLQKSIRETEQRLRQMRQQADTVRATKSVQQAQKVVAERLGGSENSLHSALKSLECIQQRQAQQVAKLKATSEFSRSNNDADLEEKLRKAGIKPSHRSAQMILERLKTRQKAQNPFQPFEK